MKGNSYCHKRKGREINMFLYSTALYFGYYARCVCCLTNTGATWMFSVLRNFIYIFGTYEEINKSKQGKIDVACIDNVK
jgi:hypothetical protein